MGDGTAYCGLGLVAYDEVSLTAIAIIISSIVLFNVGGALGYGVAAKAGRWGVDLGAVHTSKALVTQTIYRLLLLGFAIGIGIYVYRMATLFGLSMLVTDPSSTRGSRAIKYLEEFPICGKILAYLGPLCFVLTIFPWLVMGGERGRPVWRVTIAAIILILQASLLQRTNIFVCLMWAAGIALLRLRWGADGVKLPIRRFIALAALALIIFQGLALALGKTGAENSAISSTVGATLAGSQATGVLIYASSGVVGFDKLVRSNNQRWPPMDSMGPVYGDFSPSTNGLATFSAVTSRMSIAPNWQEVSPFVVTPVPTNVFTWLEPWYRDFQTWGVLIAVTVLGLVLGQMGRRSLSSHEALLFAGLLLGFSGLAGFNKLRVDNVDRSVRSYLWSGSYSERSRGKADSRVEPWCWESSTRPEGAPV